MAVTIQNVIDRAKAFSPLNASLAGDPVELVTRVQQMQQRVFTAVASLPVALLGRSRFTVAQAVTSSNSASGRTYALSALSQPMERLLRVSLGATGAEVLPVTEFDTNVNLPPRYFVRGQTLTEVSNDWSAITGTVSLSILYAFGAAAISPTGGTAQLVTVPDEWADLLVKPLAMYFHQKDPGRDPTEYQFLDAEYSAVWNGFLAYVTNYAGEFNLNAVLPQPPESRRASLLPMQG